MDLNELNDKTKSYLSKIKLSKPIKKFGSLFDNSSCPSSSNSNNHPEMQSTRLNKERKTNSHSDEDKHDEASTSKFECNICLEPAKDAVISMCGHLFCWPCLHQWFETRPHKTLCPVCKDHISRDKVIPLYGRDTSDIPTSNKDPRNKKYPPRPSGQRSTNGSANAGSSSSTFDFFGNGNGYFEPGLSAGLNNMFGGPGIHMAFGIGAFPFGFFTTMFNLGGIFPSTPTGPTPNINGDSSSNTQGYTTDNNSSTQSPFTDPHYVADDQFLSKMFLWVAILFIVWLLLA